MSRVSRKWSGRDRAGMVAVVVASLATSAVTAGPAQAQDLVHRFIDPSFGGNPFYSDHLRAIAANDRPAAPTTPTTTPTQEELIAQQLRAQLLSRLSGNILDQIQNAPVGGTGNFTVGTQQISFVRTATATTVTFTNPKTGEVNTVVIPASNASASASASASAASARIAASPLTAGQSLDAAGALAAPVGSMTAARGSAEQALLASAGPAAGGAALAPF